MQRAEVQRGQDGGRHLAGKERAYAQMTPEGYGIIQRRPHMGRQCLCSMALCWPPDPGVASADGDVLEATFWSGVTRFFAPCLVVLLQPSKASQSAIGLIGLVAWLAGKVAAAARPRPPLDISLPLIKEINPAGLRTLIGRRSMELIWGWRGWRGSVQSRTLEDRSRNGERPLCGHPLPTLVQ